MRIVVKPAGLMLIIGMISILAIIAFLKNRPDSSVPAAMADTGSSTYSSTNLLENPSFEDGMVPAPPHRPEAKGIIKGQLGKGWLENSDWADVSVDYAPDTTNPHSGKVSQRIKIVHLNIGQAQFVQELKGTPGTTYRATIWARSSKENTMVKFVLREAGEPLTEYKALDVPIGLQWRQVTLEGKVTRPGNFYLMTIHNSPSATLWLDDADLHVVK